MVSHSTKDKVNLRFILFESWKVYYDYVCAYLHDLPRTFRVDDCGQPHLESRP